MDIHSQHFGLCLLGFFVLIAWPNVYVAIQQRRKERKAEW